MVNNMSGCIFCKIVKKEIPAEIVYEDDFSLAILDINPVNIGHALIIPKEHHENIFDIPETLLGKMSVASKRVSVAIKNGLNADGINIISNNGRGAHPLVLHSHIHIIPRFLGDGFVDWKGKRGYQSGEVSEVAGKIKSNL